MSKKVPSPRKARDGAPTGRSRGGAAAKRPGKSAAAGPATSAAPRGPSKSLEPTVRLQKVLAEAGVASRRRAEELILAGKVKVNGVVVRELGTKVDPQRDRVVVAGEIARSEPKVYYLLNKPDGIVCSAEGQTDDRGRPTVLSLLQGVHERIYPVGRLDFHTRGLLLLTNDGELADLLAHPRNKVLKVYHAKFQGRLDRAALDALAKGVQLDDGVKTKPAEISVIKETDTNTWVEIGLRQGLNRQVRRMGEAIGHPVLKLIRVGLGDLDVDDLEEGQYRRLSRTEIETLRAYAQFGRDGGATKELPPAKASATAAPAASPKAARGEPSRPAGIGQAKRRSGGERERGLHGESRHPSTRSPARAARAPAVDDASAQDRDGRTTRAPARSRAASGATPSGASPFGGTPARGTPSRGTPSRGTPARGKPSRGTETAKPARAPAGGPTPRPANQAAGRTARQPETHPPTKAGNAGKAGKGKGEGAGRDRAVSGRGKRLRER